MKKLSVIIWTALLVLGCFISSYAAAIGPVRPLGDKKFSIGYENDYVFSRTIKAKVDINGGKIKDAQRNFLLLGLGLSEHFNLYARLGGGNFREQLKWSGGSEQTIKYGYGFIWGVGGNVSYKFKNNFGIGFDAQFNLASNKNKSINGSANPFFIPGGKVMVKTYEIQLTPYVSYDAEINQNCKIMPYLGGCYSYYNVYKGISFADGTGGGYFTEDEKIRGENHLGLLGGVEVLLYKQWSLKLEGRFITETALSSAVSYKF